MPYKKGQAPPTKDAGKGKDKAKDKGKDAPKDKADEKKLPPWLKKKG